MPGRASWLTGWFSSSSGMVVRVGAAACGPDRIRDCIRSAEVVQG
ncbi:hypothetical protein N136_03369 [Leifsonia aquatica ATCC 14665]|uniref:Uncharacterized protein n=1 Tax=Leifsonia aquatica ATCC 14665 TaxID=1358026 RepID=U2RNY1_LEIAQ|nr:hypothetical protein N136_03369 [Leifsonia aquatica ATCC 14665]